MNFNDFTILKYTDSDGKEKSFHPGSKSSQWCKAEKDGKTYQVKLHVTAPKWRKTDDEIRKKKSELRSCSPDDPTRKESIESAIKTLEKNKAKNDKKDKENDDFVALKKQLIEKIHRIGIDQLACPADYWIQENFNLSCDGFTVNSTITIEACPWIEKDIYFEGETGKISFVKDLTEDQQYQIVASLCRQVASLHKVGIIHSDLKLRNTVVKKDGDFKAYLIDFDAALELAELRSKKYTVNTWNLIVGGTHFAPEFIPFEIIVAEDADPDEFEAYDFNKVTEKADIFSLGVTIHEYFFGEKKAIPFINTSSGKKWGEDRGQPVFGYGYAMNRGYTLSLDNSVNDLIFSALNWALDKDPNERPTAEQLAQVFERKDLSLIPSKYQRNPLRVAHREKYKLTLPNNFTIKAVGGGDRYLVTDNVSGFIKSYSIDELVKKGYAARLGEDGTPSPMDSGNENTTWPEDGNLPLPKSVKRDSTVGKYRIYANNLFKGSVDFQTLKDRGYICSDEEKKTPWPCDKNLRFVSLRITRDLSKGEGYYLSGGTYGVKLTTQQLVERGYATNGAVFGELQTKHQALYVKNSLPSNLESIKRSAVRQNNYWVYYTDGNKEELSIDEMEARGYVSKK